LADTVGFIRHLPHKLVEAFRATLQEAADADLLMHVIDCAAEERDSNIEQVELVLAEIEADEVPQLRVYNKIDLLEHGEARIDRDEQGKPTAVWLSAREQQGFELLNQAMAELMGEELFDQQIRLQPAEAKLRAILYDMGAIRHEDYADNGDMLLDVRLQRQDFCRALARANVPESRFLPQHKEHWQS